MRLFVLLGTGAVLTGSLACAQSVITTYTTDLVNGGRDVTSTSSSSDHTQTQIAQSLNGEQVPLEQHSARVISEDANGSVTENIVKRYDPSGQFVSIERTLTELHKTADGSSTVKSTTYKSDINGGEQLAERRTTETKVAGNTTTVNVAVDQPGPNGGFQTVEKRVDVTNTSLDKKSSTTTESIYRGDSYGEMREAVRKVISQTRSGDKVVEDTTDYEPGVEAGALQFQERRVSTTTAASNGSQSTVVDVYAPSADGHVQDPGAKPQLKQQQIITNLKNPDGSTVQTFSIREPDVSDATHLGPLRQITQTVCTGNCTGAAPLQAPAPKPGAEPAKSGN